MTQSEPTDFLTSVNSFDLTLKEVIADVQAAEASDPLSSPRNPRGDEMRIRISNTCNGDSRGVHWFTVAYSISPRAAAPPGPQPQQSAAAARRSVCSYCLRGDPIGSESLQLCAECGDEGVHFSCMAVDYPSLSGQSRAFCDSCANDM